MDTLWVVLYCLFKTLGLTLFVGWIKLKISIVYIYNIKFMDFGVVRLLVGLEMEQLWGILKSYIY